MHSSACDLEPPRLGGAEVFVAIAALVTEGRAPNKNKVADVKTHVFSEGPHCTFSKASQGHVCNLDNTLCIKYDKISSYVLSLWQKSLPLCIDVLLVPKCCCETDLVCNPSTSLELIGSAILLEQWNINVSHKRTHDFSTNLNINQLINAIRSQLYFSQISAWLATPDEKIRQNFQNNTSVIYSLTVPGETYGCTKFATNSQHHNFPTADLGNGYILKVSLSNLPRTEEIPHIKCSKCDVPVQQQQQQPSSPTQNTTANVMETNISVLDDRMQTSCTLKGKHRCDDFDELDNCCNQSPRFKKHSRVKNFLNLDTTTTNGECLPSTSRNLADIQGTSKSKLQLNFHADADNKTCDNGYENLSQQDASKKDLGLSRKEFVEVLSVLRGKSKTQNTKKDLEKQSKGDILLDAILRSSKLMDMKNNSDAPATTTVAFHTKRSVVDSTGDKVEETNILPLGTTNCLDRNKRQCMMHNKSGITSLPCDDNAASVKHSMRDGDNTCDKNDSIIISDNKIRNSNNQHNIYVDINCDNVKRKKSDYIKMCDISNVFSLEYLEKRQKVKVKQKITFDDDDNDERTSYTKCNSNKTKELCLSENNHKTNESIENNNEENVVKEINQTVGIPSALEQAKFRKSLDSAASMVFHSRTGLPLTSSPAPVRRGKSCFDFDSSINSVSAIRSALFSLAHCSADEDSESDCSIVSPCSPDATNGLKQRDIPPIKYKHRGQSSGLLGNFEESVLNGRLEPVSTVHGFSAELGASGSFCPRHVVLPVTVFFYTLGDNDKVSTPYLGHINLGKKGYNVPKTGTIQVTLFNPLGTVVKMFVIMYDLSDMPPNSQTFIRQRTLFMPANCEDKNLEWSQKWLRYLIHLRFMSSKSGRIFLHSDIRMIICRKSDLDTATAHGIDMSYELRSFTHSPANPKFSPRK